MGGGETDKQPKCITTTYFSKQFNIALERRLRMTNGSAVPLWQIIENN